jgi:hypothetical protein
VGHFRKDVLNVVKELDFKTLELSVTTMRKRLEKHFTGPDDQVCFVFVATT